MAAKKSAAKKKADKTEVGEDEMALSVVLPWEGERPKRPVVPIGDKRLVFKAQLGGDEYAACLTHMADKSARGEFLAVAITDESKADLIALLDDEEGIGGVAATRITVSLARHYGMLGPGGDAPDPS